MGFKNKRITDFIWIKIYIRRMMYYAFTDSCIYAHVINVVCSFVKLECILKQFKERDELLLLRVSAILGCQLTRPAALARGGWNEMNEMNDVWIEKVMK